MAYLLLLLILQNSVVFAELTVNGDQALAKTTVGDIAGVLENIVLPDNTESSLAVFRGIPYAEPPLGNLRFAKPVPRTMFSSLFNASEYGPACPQSNAQGHTIAEDCLYLNIYVPATARAEEVAVMVVVHGGAFVSGEGRRQDVQNLAVFGDLLVVTINYRLGPLGFFAVEGHADVTGNQGLYDQQLALQWVKVNIRAFGGDPGRITIMGGSAGAMSVTYQAMFPDNAGLFHRFIAISGTALSAAAYLTQDQGYSASSRLSREVGCVGRDDKPSVECLRGLDLEDILSKGQSMMLMDGFFLSWAPVEDGNMVRNPFKELTSEASEQLSEQTRRNLSGINPMLSMDAMLGTMRADGSVSVGIFVEGMAAKQNISLYHGVPQHLFLHVVDALMDTTHVEKSSSATTSSVRQSSSAEATSAVEKTSSSNLISKAVVYEYNNWRNVSDLEQLGQNTVDLLTDKQFFVPNVVFANSHSLSSSAKTFVFEFDEEKNPAASYYPWMLGAPHGAFNVYVAGLPESRLGRELDLDAESDRKKWDLSRTVMTYWSNFAKSGDPNLPSSEVPEWPAYDTNWQTSQLFTLDVTSSRMRNRAKRTEFWLSLIPSLAKAQSDLTGLSERDNECGNTGTNGSSQQLATSLLIILQVFASVAKKIFENVF